MCTGTNVAVSHMEIVSNTKEKEAEGYTQTKAINLYSDVRNPFHHPSLTEVTNGWPSFSALFLSNLLSPTVNIPNNKAQNIPVSTILCNIHNSVRIPEYFSIVLCFIIWNIDSRREQIRQKRAEKKSCC